MTSTVPRPEAAGRPPAASSRPHLTSVSSSRRRTLSDPELRRLLWRAQDGDVRARTRLLEQFEGLVMSIARRALRSESSEITLDDLAQEGRAALLTAILRAVVPPRVEVTAFMAMRIRGAISDAAAASRSVGGVSVRVPRDQWREVRKARQVEQQTGPATPGAVLSFTRSEDGADLVVDQAPGPEEIVVSRARMQIVMSKLMRLPVAERDAILRCLEGQPSDAAARGRGFSALSRMSCIREALVG